MLLVVNFANLAVLADYCFDDASVLQEVEDVDIVGCRTIDGTSTRWLVSFNFRRNLYPVKGCEGNDREIAGEKINKLLLSASSLRFLHLY